MRLYDNAAHDFFYFSDWKWFIINYQLTGSLVQRPHKVVVLEVALQLDLGISIDSLSIHFVGKPLSAIVALVGPGVAALALSVSVAELTFIDVSICEDVKT
jgi:hypothetical protein